ncbi:MAG TPA: hypothetical protein DCO72_08320 [Ruminococcus sp.]|nr:hypothetical protein [Ruminococcus sp.]
MKRAKIIYLLTLAGLMTFYVLYIDYLPLLLLITALILPVLLKLSVLLLHFMSDCSLSCQAHTSTAETSVPVTMMLDSHCPLFFSRGEAKIRITHKFAKKAEVIKLKFPVHPFNTTRLTFYVQADFCGAVQVKLDKVRVYDLFRLSYTNIRSQHKKDSILILPKPIPIPLDESAPPVEQMESDRYADKAGDDPSEIYAVREYMAGDPVSRMHWKLSSRLDKLMLKEFSFPVEKFALILVEYCPTEKGIQDAQALLTLIYSMALQLIRMEHPCILAWYDGNKGEMLQCQPDSESALVDAFRKLYSSLQTMTGDFSAVREGLTGMIFSSATLISNTAESSLLPLLEEQLTANQKTFIPITDLAVELRSDFVDIQPVETNLQNLTRIII